MHAAFKFILFSGLVLAISTNQSCQRAGCDDESIIYKHRVLQEWGTSKYAYTGDETLVFYEIQNDDTAEVVFEPHNNFDTTFSDISWYQADNDDWCKGYVTDIDGRIDEYHCAERDWYFLAAQVSPKHEIKLQFRQKGTSNSDSNFSVFFDPEYLDSLNTNGPIWSQYYIGDTTIGELSIKELFKLDGGDKYDVFYDNKKGLVQWNRYSRDYKLVLKKIIH